MEGQCFSKVTKGGEAWLRPHEALGRWHQRLSEWVQAAWPGSAIRTTCLPSLAGRVGQTAMRQDENGWLAVWSMVMKTNDSLGPPQMAELSPQDKPALSFHEKLLCWPKRETWEQMTPLDSVSWPTKELGSNPKLLSKNPWHRRKWGQEGWSQTTYSVYLAGNESKGTFMFCSEFSTDQSRSDS